MTEYPGEQQPSSPDQSQEPELVEHSIDTLMEAIWDRPKIEQALDHILDRQKELIAQLREKRETEEQLTSAEEMELDEINGTILSIQHLIERYGSDD